MTEISNVTLQAATDFMARVTTLAVMDHSGRGGNAFFLTLFDEHPEVVCCPWIHYTYSYILTEFGDQTEIDAQAAHHFATTKSYFRLVYQDVDPGNLVRRIGGDPDAAKIDRALTRQVFDAMLKGRKTITRRELALLPLVAVAIGRGFDLSQARYAVVSDAVSLRSERVSDGFSGRVIDAMIADNPSARLVSLVRDPRATFASPRHQFVNSLGNMYALRPGNFGQRLSQLLRHDLTPDTGAVQVYWLMYLAQSARTIYRQKARYPDNFLTVRNEDLNTAFVPAIEQVAAWLGVSVLDAWRDPDYVPTMVGVCWTGTGAYNSQYQRYVNGPLLNDADEVARNVAGPNLYVTQRWRSRLNPREIELIERLCREEMIDQRYQILFDDPVRSDDQCFVRTALGPFEGELPKLEWIQRGLKDGFGEFLNRLYYAITFAPFYVVARAVLYQRMKRGLFRGIVAASPNRSTT